MATEVGGEPGEGGVLETGKTTSRSRGPSAFSAPAALGLSVAPWSSQGESQIVEGLRREQKERI